MFRHQENRHALGLNSIRGSRIPSAIYRYHFLLVQHFDFHGFVFLVISTIIRTQIMPAPWFPDMI
jgi:hypothetical protein